MDVIISTREKRIYHKPFCPYAGRINEGYRKQISEEKAIRQGRCACKFCSGTRGAAYDWRKRSGMDISYDPIDNAMCVRTQSGFWKLIWRENYQEWHVFHMNHKGWDSFDPAKPTKELMRGSFHRQRDYKSGEKVGKILTYIRKHDRNYLLAETDIRKMPRSSPEARRRYRQQKKRKKREGVRTVYKILNTLEKENCHE